MSFCKERVKLASFLAAVTFSSGCATPGAQRFGMSFLPAVPRQSPEVMAAALEAPPVPGNKWITESHAFLKPNIEFPPRPSLVDLRLRRADDRFNQGRELYNQGDIAGARVEFDAAIDTLLR